MQGIQPQSLTDEEFARLLQLTPPKELTAEWFASLVERMARLSAEYKPVPQDPRQLDLF